MAIELPNGKICRNLPEQVAENLKNIKEIQDLLDGLNIQDNLVVIADLSQILNANEIEIVERPIAFLYYNNQLYIKRNETGGNAYFDVIFTISEDSGEIEFETKEIEVILNTGALNYASSSSYTYTKAQIDTDLAAKANDNEVAKLAGANFTGAITSPSIIEDMPGYSFEASNPDFHSVLFAGVVKNGNKITFVITGVINRQASHTSYNTYLGTFTAPASIVSQLVEIPITGYNPIDIQYLPIFANLAGTPSFTKVFNFEKQDSTRVRLMIRAVDSLPLETPYFYRYEATYLLGDNLAL